MPAPDENAIPNFSNIGAFHITEDTMKYSGNLFRSLRGILKRNFPISYRLAASAKGLYMNAKKKLRIKLEWDYPKLFKKLRAIRKRNG